MPHHNKIAFGLATTIALTFAPELSISAYAGDFSRAQRTYVPPSMYDRRIDFATVREQSATTQLGNTASVSHAVKRTASSTASAGKALSSTITKSGTVPPPPPYPSSLVQTGKNLSAQAKKLASSPQAQAAISSMKHKAADLARSGKFEEAKQYAARALQLSPADKTVLKNMANVTLDRAKQFVNSGEMDKALQYARESLAYDTNNVEAKRLVNSLLDKAGINPQNPESRLKNAEELAAAGRHDEAFAEYEAALKLKPSAEAHIGIGNIAAQAGQKDRAKSEYQAALDVDANSAAAHRQLGLLKYQQGDVVGANAALSRALVLNPKDKVASKSLIELWQQQVARVPGANSHLGLARAYQLSGDLQAAQTQYRNVVRLDPENPHLPAARQAFKLALARQEADRNLQAARNLETHGAHADAYEKAKEAVRLSPGDAELRVYQGQLSEKLQHYGVAREAYLNALKINPSHAVAAERLKNLPSEPVASAPAALGGLAAPYTAPPGNVQLPPQLITGSGLGLSGATTGSTSAAPAIPSHDPVSNISNFAVALREQMVTSKAQIQQVEDIAHQVMKSITPGAASAASEGLVTAAAGADAAATATTAATPAAAAPATDAAGDASIESALSNAADAIAKAKGTTGGIGKSASNVSNTLKQVNTLKDHNAKLSDQLKKMHKGWQQIHGVDPDAQAAAPAAVTGATTGTISEEPPLAPPIAQTVAQYAPTGQALSPTIDPSAAVGADLPVRPQAFPISAPPQFAAPTFTPTPLPPSSALRDTMPVPNAVPVRLELETASPKLGSVELSVLLRNDAEQTLVLPTTKLRAVINYTNRRPAEVKVLFADATVPAHGAIRGTIRVPFDKVDPTADLVIPELLPPGTPQRDVHLITSMALRQSL